LIEGLLEPFAEGGHGGRLHFTEGQAGAESRLRIEDGGGGFESLFAGKNFDGYLGAAGEGSGFVEIAAVEADFVDAHFFRGGVSNAAKFRGRGKSVTWGLRVRSIHVSALGFF
jgi:hypothetical protein